MSDSYDMIVIGAGISGLAMAFDAQQAGRRVLVLEKAGRAGGCFHSELVPDDGEPFWLEMGTHTCFNSYGRLLRILRALELTAQMQPREKLRYRMLVDGQLVSIPSQLRWLELLTHAWRLFTLSKQERTIADYYSAIVGPENYRRVFRHAFNAVICQPADAMPAGMLFRKRPRDKSVERSYTFNRGLGRIISALAERVPLRTGVRIRQIERTASGYRITTADGSCECAQLVCATPAPAAARLLATAHADIAERLGWINEVEIESVGVVVERSALALPPLAGIIAADDAFYSAVSRDVVGHAHLRGFTFHFRPGEMTDEQKRARVCAVLGIDAADLLYEFHKTNRLPAPDIGHPALIGELDALLAGEPLALVGNYFNGVAVEDCLERVELETQRLAAAL